MTALGRSVLTGVAGFSLGVMLTSVVTGQAPVSKLDGKLSHIGIVVRGGKWVQGIEQYNFGYVDLTPQLGFTVEVMGPKINLPAQ